ncbi:hypothetical protein [Tropicimonas sp. IMCC34043]|uniref:hypothetical protein n=1 Tax=Tropicimonas sp. IMCC34043 TaxID=2248760 RepID=UPI0018E53662|nr:hypothetical protein [Tropicimonas sp. IMCC34043]
MKILPFAAAVALTPALAGIACATSVQPLERAHAHNDYEHTRPLFDALDNGFTSVEADVWLVDGQLYVAHDYDEIDTSKTLQSLYLDPLREMIEANEGSVYGDGTKMNLLIDVKSSASATWELLDSVLASYSDIFTAFSTSDGRTDGAVTAHISGNRDYDAMADSDLRYAGYDGRSNDLLFSDMLDGDLVTMVSQNWTKLFSWRGVGEMSATEEQFLADYVAKAHANGQIVRFWNTPDAAGAARDALWAKLIEHDVDLINTDDLSGLQAFLLANDPNEMAAVPLPGGVWLLGGALAFVGTRRRRRAA